MTDFKSLIDKWYLIAPVSNYGNRSVTDKEFLCTLQNVWGYITTPERGVSDHMTRQELEERYLRIFNRWYEDSLKYYLKESETHTSVATDIKRVRVNTNRKWFFITIGFDDKTITVQGIKNAIEKLFSIKGIEVDRYVVEKYRRDDLGNIYIHHHIHTIVYTDYSKSKVIQYVYQKLKKFLASDNFVDCKRSQPLDNYIKYINGDKTSTKLECIELDRKWRQENNL